MRFSSFADSHPKNMLISLTDFKEKRKVLMREISCGEKHHILTMKSPWVPRVGTTKKKGSEKGVSPPNSSFLRCRLKLHPFYFEPWRENRELNLRGQPIM